jgi:hypothetical protein
MPIVVPPLQTIQSPSSNDSKTDYLPSLLERYQQRWQNERIFGVNAPPQSELAGLYLRSVKSTQTGSETSIHEWRSPSRARIHHLKSQDMSTCWARGLCHRPAYQCVRQSYLLSTISRPSAINTQMLAHLIRPSSSCPGMIRERCVTFFQNAKDSLMV